MAEGGVHIGRDHGFGTPELHAQGMIGCQLAACPDAATAEDAAVVVHDEILSRSIDRDLGIRVLVDPMVHAITVGECLELTVAAHLTEHAVMVPLGKEHLKDEFSLLNHLGRFGLHLHSFRYRKGAGRLKGALSLDLDETDPAGAMGRQGRMIAEIWDIDPCCLCRL